MQGLFTYILLSNYIVYYILCNTIQCAYNLHNLISYVEFYFCLKQEQFWTWPYYKSISYLTVIQVGFNFKLIIINDQDNSIDIYDITFENVNQNMFTRRKPYFA